MRTRTGVPGHAFSPASCASGTVMLPKILSVRCCAHAPELHLAKMNSVHALHGKHAIEAQPVAAGFQFGRRAALAGAACWLLGTGIRWPAQAGILVPPANIQTALTPDQSLYDAADPQLRAAANLLQEGLNAPDVVAEEAIWTRIIDMYSNVDKPWVPDVVGRAWGNRGNARSRQGRLEEALNDYNTSISICPWSVDPVLNRGVVLEAMGKFDEAIADYQAVLAAAPQDPAGWNNLGNATAGKGEWQEAVGYYTRAFQLAPEFSFAAANRALALYQAGDREQSIREMRNLLRKYPGFTDMRAGLAAALWGAGLEGQAETQWERVDDPRYRDVSWLKDNRRWPPALVSNLQALLSLTSVKQSA